MVHTAPDAISQMVNRGKDHFPGPAYYINATQYVVGLLCRRDALLTHVQLGVHQDPTSFYAFQLIDHRVVLVRGVIPPWVQDLAFALVDIREGSR